MERGCQGLSEWGVSAHCWVLRQHPQGVVLWSAIPREANRSAVTSGRCFGCVVCVWLVFENCTVDASIFVAKLLRAHGGCLGIRSR